MLRPAALQPDAALAFWGSKTPVSRAEFDALEQAAKAKAFTVSGLAKQDQIGFVQSQIYEAMKNGETLSDFKRRIPDVIKAQGWTGKKAWRVENLFRTSTQSAYMAGRYAQMKRVAKIRPFWRYSAIGDSRTRPAHLALNGLVYRHDHPFWDRFYPPNGYACRCTVQTLSKRQVEAKGLTVQEEMPDRSVVKDPVTGAEQFVQPLPDKGWDSNVGQDWLSGLTPSELDGPLTDIVTGALCKNGRGMFADDPCKPPLAGLDPRHIHVVQPGDIMRKGLHSEQYVRAFLQEFGLKNIDDSKVHELPGGIPVVISKRFFLRDKDEKADWKVKKRGREQFVKLLARTILDPFEVWQTEVKIGRKLRPSLNLLRLFKNPQGRIGGYVVFHLVNGRSWQGATAYAPDSEKDAGILRYLERKRNGRLLFREELK